MTKGKWKADLISSGDLKGIENEFGECIGEVKEEYAKQIVHEHNNFKPMLEALKLSLDIHNREHSKCTDCLLYKKLHQAIKNEGGTYD